MEAVHFIFGIVATAVVLFVIGFAVYARLSTKKARKALEEKLRNESK